MRHRKKQIASTVTDEEYDLIAEAAKKSLRSISSFVKIAVLREIERLSKQENREDTFTIS